MHSSLAFRLASSNIRREHKFYLPYILASTGIVMMFYMMSFMWTSSGIKPGEGGYVVQFVMKFGLIVIGLFSAIFMMYINNFLMKRRSNEMGIYSILGMDKKNISGILGAETLISSSISIISGIVLGIIFSRLCTMILRRMLDLSISDTPVLSVKGIVITAVFFAALFTFLLLRNCMHLRFTSVIDMLHGSDDGEREPKNKVILSLIGIAALAAGYTMALTIDNPVSSLRRFFFAVILVISGTYLLFTTVSIAVLKLLKRNKKYYYKPEHMTAVSGLLFRMKQNAVGMANICVLSTIVLVTVSTTFCLQQGIDHTIDNVVPYQASFMVRMDSGSTDTMSDSRTARVMSGIENAASKNNVKITKSKVFSALTFNAKINTKKGTLYLRTKGATRVSPTVFVITESGYNKLTGKNVDLKKNEGI
ncbi:MAG: FtsX-like permease family protein, partial [Anaerovoracaceae bacterium]